MLPAVKGTVTNKAASSTVRTTVPLSATRTADANIPAAAPANPATVLTDPESVLVNPDNKRLAFPLFPRPSLALNPHGSIQFTGLFPT